MGKPRLIILVRHAQSEGNKNRAIHQVVPDHRVKLTEEGHKQAAEAGIRLRKLLKPDDTLQIFTSPYRRTRETTEGLLKTLTSTSDEAPSPFSRSKIKLYEEPRLREQDFGNFQPNSEEMERMWRERADYGHFFYRIPNGESAADAYDRVSGFNESLWRQFGDREFPSVLVLVTHGLMTRVFLMKWYHWSVEYFEDLRNVNHCEFVLMKMNQDSGKYILESELRTWSEYKRLKQAEEANRNPSRRNTLSAFLKTPLPAPPEMRHWTEGEQSTSLQHAATIPTQSTENERDDHALGPHEPATDAGMDGTFDFKKARAAKSIPSYLSDVGPSSSGDNTPHEMPSDDEIESYPFPRPLDNQQAPSPAKSMAAAMRKTPQRKPTQEDIERWTNESGMGSGRQADGLGDEPEEGNDRESLTRELEEAERDDKSLHGSVY